jgi:hypothetical protein
MDIKKILEEHKLWFETGGKEGARANLRGADLHGTDLGGVNLSDTDLRDANLRNSNLRNAYFGGANLGGANLSWADFRDADFRDANLSDAYFRYSDFRGAYFGGANLHGANLRGADFHGADFHGAKGIIQWQAPQGKKRICYSVKYDDCVMNRLGCFWGTTDEAVKAIRKKYGEGSLYEKFLLMQVEALQEGE